MSLLLSFISDLIDNDPHAHTILEIIPFIYKHNFSQYFSPTLATSMCLTRPIREQCFGDVTDISTAAGTVNRTVLLIH